MRRMPPTTEAPWPARASASTRVGCWRPNDAQSLTLRGQSPRWPRPISGQPELIERAASRSPARTARPPPGRSSDPAGPSGAILGKDQGRIGSDGDPAAERQAVGLARLGHRIAAVVALEPLAIA